MPVYNEDTFNYEILLRFGDTGPNKGQLTGASRSTITQTTKDGVPIATNINAPEQLALIAGEEGQLLSTVLGEINAATIIENQTLAAALAEARQQSAATQEAAVAQIADLTTRLEQALADLTSATAPEKLLAAQDLPNAESPL